MAQPPHNPSAAAPDSLTGRIVGACCRHAWWVLLLALLLTGAAGLYSSRHFAMTTDTAELISPDLPYRQREIALNAAFPQNQDMTVVVLDGATSELAELGAARLYDRLKAREDLFRTVRRPDGGSFFARYGLMLLPLAEVQANADQLIQAQPFLGPLAADPSLRGVMGALDTVLLGVERGQAKLEDIRRPLEALAASFGAVAEGGPGFFSWRNLFSDQPAGVRETRKFILVQAKLDYGSLEPGARASAAIREAARELGLDAARGVTVRLTGSVPLSDEEFATLAEGASLMGIAMVVCLVAMVWLAVRSWRFALAILLSTILGLVLTAGAGLLVIGRFNLISVAFIPLFVGLGVDFGIQVSVRARAERLRHPALGDALVAAGNAVGGSLALAAAAIAAGFFAFLPTSYIGVSELGAIAGVGMVVAFVLSITLLPALLTLLRPAGEAREVGFAALAPVETWLHRHHRGVIAAAVLLAVGSVALMPRLTFDFNPLHLRSEKVESVSTIEDLMKDPDRSPYTIDVLMPSLAEADSLAKRIAPLPEVAQVVTLDSFVPGQQEEKLAAIQDAADLLSLTLDPVSVRPPPTDAEVVESFRATAAGLRRAAGEAKDAQSGAGADAARSLATALERLAGASPDVRARASEAVITPLRVLLAQIRDMLSAGPVTVETLPPELRADWVAPDGRARVQVFPQGGTSSNEALRRFAAAVQAVAPQATGAPISLQEAGDSIVHAFLQAGVLSAIVITLLLAFVLRRVRDVLLTILPVIASGLLTLGACVVLGEALNFANIIALPLLFGIGVAFNIYYVMAWRQGEAALLSSSLTRAIVFSALTTATGFGSLWLSTHPGTASMGRLLMISLACVLLVILLLQPALLARPAAGKR
ncbi:MMPL family transporter [Roseomonas gilardii]|uniref:MMPL family transporter n=1 Tax=Roseomonas gilardii TaxID=257708 RepID=A0ABU3MG22_9PROT|nr:MMPL family transporter [Roseomonas gilardii]MDT8331580.1 MMPL family transporter [Roseomonas gilardii]